MITTNDDTLAGSCANVKRRRDNAAGLSAGLAGAPRLRLPTELAGRSHVWHQYTVLVTGDAPVRRDHLITRLTDKRVDRGLRYPRTVNDYECYRHYPRVDPDPARVAERVVQRCASLPVHQHLSDGDVERIVEVAPEAVVA